MSTFLAGIERALSQAVHIVDGVVAPDVFVNGYPMTNEGQLCIDEGGVIATYVKGIPYTAAGRVVTSALAPVLYIGSWPIDINGRVARGVGTTVSVSNSIPLTTTDLNTTAVVPPPNPTFLDLPGGSGNYASTPDSVLNSVVGSLDIQFDVLLSDWTPAASDTLMAKWAGADQDSFIFRIDASGLLRLSRSSDGGAGGLTSVASTVVTGFGANSRHFVRVTYDAVTGDVTFYVGGSRISEWIQLGDVVVSTPAAIFDGTSPIEIGSLQNGTVNVLTGKVYCAMLFDGIDGSIASNFQPNFHSGLTTWTESSTGEVWTINGTALIP